MKTFPLPSITVEQAKNLQFKIIDTITKYFDGREILSTGDLGVVLALNKPIFTRKAEHAIAEIFGAQDAVLVRGSGTGAIRWGLAAVMNDGGKLLVHTSPIYPTTEVSIKTMGIKIVRADFNDDEDIRRALDDNNDIKAVLVQLTRQKMDDRYDYQRVISEIRSINRSIKIITDDNYAALKVNKIGVQCGADLSSFSCFKLLGPEGVGALIGDENLIATVRNWNYSGGSQVQGHEAMETLRGLVYAPVALAIQAEVNEEIVGRLNKGEIPEVKNAFLANAQSKVLLVEFREEIAENILKYTSKHGAAAHPVGCESKYEFVPMIYRISGTFRKQDPTLEKRMIRINPMRSGAETVIRILRESIKDVKNMGAE